MKETSQKSPRHLRQPKQRVTLRKPTFNQDDNLFSFCNFLLLLLNHKPFFFSHFYKIFDHKFDERKYSVLYIFNLLKCIQKHEHKKIRNYCAYEMEMGKRKKGAYLHEHNEIL